MRTLTKYTVFIIITLISLASCKNSGTDVHNVEAEFEPYIQRFFDYADKYGVELKSRDIVMKFNTLSDGKAGVCYMNMVPIRIDIDRDNWEHNLYGPNADNEKEDLIFHEMGHGFLRRYHLNDVLKNGDWKTIMCGDELPDGRASNINYRGMRKEYYIKELFTQTTEVPTWSTYVPDFSKLSEKVELNATATTPTCWFIHKDDDYNGRIEGNNYVLETLKEFATYIPIKTLLGNRNIYDVTKDFYFEAKVKIFSDKISKTTIGLAFADYNQEKETLNPLHYIMYSKSKYINVGENSCGTPFIQLYSNKLNVDDFNTVGVRKQNDTLFYYLNGEFLYHNDLTGIPISGKSFGFTLSGNSTLYCEYATIKVPSSFKSAAAEEPTNKEATPFILGELFHEKKSY